MSSPDPSDDHLARAARDGQAAAFDGLMRRYGVRLLGYLRSVGVPESDLEDLAQEVWVKVYAALPRWQDGSFRGWLFRIAHNHAEDARRGRRRTAVVTNSDLIDLQSADPRGTDPDFFRKLAECLEHLPPVYRSAVEGLSAGRTYEEIAATLGQPLGTIKSRINRGRDDLRKCLGPYAE
jgi:RNA polymerase sigma-70 factor (ECF subfamily)